MKEEAREALKGAPEREGEEGERGQSIRQTSSFAEEPTISQNHESSPFINFPWMIIFDSAMAKAQPNAPVKDLTNYIVKSNRKAIVSGAFADIWTGKLTINLENHSLSLQVAMKQLRHTAPRERMDRRHEREMTVWSKLRHPNILPFLGLAEVDGWAPCFISPFMPNGDVLAYMQSNPKVDRILIIRGVVQGITYLHTQRPPVVHGDIKGLNILISSEGNAVLCDFGLSMFLDPTLQAAATTTSAGRGSARWFAPERLKPEDYGTTLSKSRTLAADMFAFAITAVEILSGEPPYKEDETFLACSKIVEGVRPDIPEPYASDPQQAKLVQAIRACWDQDRDKRMTAEEVFHLLG